MIGQTNAITGTEIQLMRVFAPISLVSTNGIYITVGPPPDSDYTAKDFLVIVSSDAMENVYFNYGDYYGPKNLSPYVRRNKYDYGYTAMIYVKCRPSLNEVHMWDYFTDEYIAQLYVPSGCAIQLYTQSSHYMAYAATICPPPIIKNYVIPNS